MDTNMNQLEEPTPDQMQSIINMHMMNPPDPYRLSIGQVKHIRDALFELSTKSDGVKKTKLEIFAVNWNAVLQSMQLSDQEFIYLKSKLN